MLSAIDVRRSMSSALLVLCAISFSTAAAQTDRVTPRGSTNGRPGDPMAHTQMNGGTHRPLPHMASGTSWEPASSPMDGLHFSGDGWSVMLHGFATLDYMNDRGPRGDRDWYSTNMMMGRAERSIGTGTLALRVMGSAEPSMGPAGYPLLLQTGETADGILPLRDRQHPHDLFMELSATYTVPLDSQLTLFAYFAPVGEPAFGPVTFMHRASGMELPRAPIAHHSQDATHITYGVATLGIVSDNWLKIEASLFNGLEPDQYRWGIEAPRFDSYSARLTVNIGRDWTWQGSVAGLVSPERMHPGIDYVKLTTSATYNRPLTNGNWQTTLIYGRNKNQRTLIPVPEARATFPPAIFQHYIALAELTGLPEDSLILFFPTQTQSSLLLESTRRTGRLAMMGRVERVTKNELFEPSDIRHSQIFPVGKIEAGFVLDVLRVPFGALGLGLAGSLHILPQELRDAYGTTPTSYQIFSRFALH